MKYYKKKSVVLFSIFFIISATFVSIEYYRLAKPGLIVLLYHKVTKEDNINSKYDINVQKFTEHLRILKEKGYSTVLPIDIIYNKENLITEKSIIISFDDGTQDHYHTVFRLLKQNEYSAVFFVVSKYLNSKNVLNEEQVKEMSLKGMEIGSHSFSHPFLETLNQDDLLYELKKSKERIEEITHKTVVSFAPPGGWYNEKVLETARAVGYEAFFSCEIGKNNLNQVPFVFKRIEVLGDITNREFEGLLEPSFYLLFYKIGQSLKFLVHKIIGTEYYKKLGNLIKEIKIIPYTIKNKISHARS